jgi:crossover junction endodeoxyribonuclease RuvC
MRVLGIDPGTLRMGYGVLAESQAGAGGAPRVALPWSDSKDGFNPWPDGLRQPQVEDYGVISLPGTMPLEKRLFQLYTHVLNLIHVFQPEAVAVEEPFVGKGERQFIGPAIAVGQAQAVVLIAAASQALPVFRYSPAQVKLAVADYGAASKEQMQRAIAATLGLPEVPEADAADALSVGLCHLAQGRVSALLAREIPPGRER